MNSLHKENLFAFLFSGNPKKTDTDQITLEVFLLYLKRNDSQKLQKVFLQVYVFGTTCFDKCFLIHLIIAEAAAQRWS